MKNNRQLVDRILEGEDIRSLILEWRDRSSDALVLVSELLGPCPLVYLSGGTYSGDESEHLEYVVSDDALNDILGEDVAARILQRNGKLVPEPLIEVYTLLNKVNFKAFSPQPHWLNKILLTKSYSSPKEVKSFLEKELPKFLKGKYKDFLISEGYIE